MDYQFMDKKGKHRYDSLLKARNAAETACKENKQDITLIECGTGRKKCVFRYDAENSSAKLALPGRE